MPKPAEILGITGANAIWKLQYGLPGVSGIKEVSAADLATFELVPYFASTADGWVQVRVPVNAGTTSGSSYPRDELRQMGADGKTEAAWDTSKVDCWFEYELKPTHLPAAKPQMCVMQLHDDKNDLLEIIWQRNSAGGYELTQRVAGTAKGQPLIPHDVNRSCVLALGLVKGAPTIYRDGVAILTTTKMPQSTKAYAKLLNYLQSNTSTDKAGEYGEILARNVRTGLGAYPGPQSAPIPVDPPPTPDPTPVPNGHGPVVILRRHAEKPAGSAKGYAPDGSEDPHSLTRLGWARAKGLVAEFSVPRSDLFRPTRIYAADGPNAGARMTETVSFLAAELGLTTITRFDKGSESSLATELKALPAGEVALVCWEHTNAADIAKAFGRKISWPDANFNGVLVFTGDGAGNWAFRQTAELVLPTDRPIGLDGKPVVVGTMPTEPPVSQPPVALPPVIEPPVVIGPPPVVEPDPPADPAPSAPAAPSWWSRFLEWLSRLFK